MSETFQKKTPRVMSDMVTSSSRKPLREKPSVTKEVTPSRVVPSTPHRLEHKKVQPIITEEVTAPQDFSHDENLHTSRPRGCILPVITFLCMTLLILVVGGLFARVTITLTAQTRTEPLDVSLNLSSTGSSEGIPFATSTQTFTEIVPLDAASTPEHVAEASVQLHDRMQAAYAYPAMREKMIQNIPQRFVILPLSFYSQEPVITFEKDDQGALRIIGQKKCTLLLVERNTFAQKIKERLKIQDNLTYTLLHESDLTFTTQVLATPDSLPDTIPVRITGNVTLQGDIDQEKVLAHALGTPKKEFFTWVTSLPEVKKAKVKMIPFWRTLIPREESRVSLEKN